LGIQDHGFSHIGILFSKCDVGRGRRLSFPDQKVPTTKNDGAASATRSDHFRSGLTQPSDVLKFPQFDLLIALQPVVTLGQFDVNANEVERNLHVRSLYQRRLHNPGCPVISCVLITWAAQAEYMND
jgi:hypothetical protein